MTLCVFISSSLSSSIKKCPLFLNNITPNPFSLPFRVSASDRRDVFNLLMQQGPPRHKLAVYYQCHQSRQPITSVSVGDVISHASTSPPPPLFLYVAPQTPVIPYHCSWASGKTNNNKNTTYLSRNSNTRRLLAPALRLFGSCFFHFIWNVRSLCPILLFAPYVTRMSCPHIIFGSYYK